MNRIRMLPTPNYVYADQNSCCIQWFVQDRKILLKFHENGAVTLECENHTTGIEYIDHVHWNELAERLHAMLPDKTVPNSTVSIWERVKGMVKRTTQ